MTKQEEIREGIANYVHMREQGFCIYEDGSYPCQDDGCDSCTARAIMSQLHSQGVVIGVDKELPFVKWNADERKGFLYALDAGYVAIEPLIGV